MGLGGFTVGHVRLLCFVHCICICVLYLFIVFSLKKERNGTGRIYSRSCQIVVFCALYLYLCIVFVYCVSFVKERDGGCTVGHVRSNQIESKGKSRTAPASSSPSFRVASFQIIISTVT